MYLSRYIYLSIRKLGNKKALSLDFDKSIIYNACLSLVINSWLYEYSSRFKFLLTIVFYLILVNTALEI